MAPQLQNAKGAARAAQRARDRFAPYSVLRVLLLLLVCLCAASLLRAQANDDETVYDLGPGVTPPRVVKQVNPHYATDHGVRAVGSVIIGLVVSSRGLPKDPHVVKGMDRDLDQSAVEAVKEWRFAPAQKNGKAVAVRVSVQIEFHSM
jgi:TonB family protein